jgi:hypothetical protein
MSVTGSSPQITSPTTQPAPLRRGLRERMRNSATLVPTLNHDKFVRIRFRPLIPIILAASALLYNQGQQNKLSSNGRPVRGNNWLEIITESTVGYLMLKLSSGLYPLTALVLSIYRASQENNALDKTKAIISTLVPLGMGFIGANLLDPYLMEKRENQKLKKLLAEEGEPQAQLSRWITALKNDSQEATKDMGHALEDLKTKLLHGQEQLKNVPDAKKRFRILHDEIAEIKADLGETIEEGAEHALNLADQHTAKPMAERVIQHLAESQSALTKITRQINPVCSFMFFAFLLGTPLANRINRHLGQSHPAWKNKGIAQQPLFSQNPLLLPTMPAPPAHNRHIFQANPIPSIQCPDVGDGKTLY